MSWFNVQTFLIAFWIVGSGCIVLVQGQSTSTDGDFDANTMCTLVPNGTFINDPTDCVTWIQCVDYEPVFGECENDTFYDLETNQCVPEDSITCLSTDPCAAISDGFTADPYSCNSYYYCTDGIGSQGTCSVGLNFNPTTKACTRGYICTLQNPTGYCNIVPEGVFIKNPSDCNGWEMCWEGEIENGTCPGTFYYNAFNGDCDYPENVNCTTQPSLPSGNGICPAAGAFISDNATCNGYYYCRETTNGQIVLQHADCPSGRFFNPYIEGGSCVNRTEMVCEYDACGGMGIDAIQLANAPNDDCKGYLVCQSGVTIGNGTCPNNEYYNEWIQLCTTEVIDFRACNGTAYEPTTTEPPTTSPITTESTTSSPITITTELSTITESPETTEPPTTTSPTTTPSTTTPSTTTTELPEITEPTTESSTTTESPTTTPSTTTPSTTTPSTTTPSTTTTESPETTEPTTTPSTTTTESPETTEPTTTTTTTSTTTTTTTEPPTTTPSTATTTTEPPTTTTPTTTTPTTTTPTTTITTTESPTTTTTTTESPPMTTTTPSTTTTATESPTT